MQILELLKKDHAEVKQLLDKIADTGGAKTRQRLFEKMKAALLTHAHAEQSTFYAALEEHEESAELARVAEVEHEVVERLLQDLSSSDMDSERWAAKCKVLKELVEHHIKEEESQIFKIARRVFDKSQLQQLGDDMKNAKQHMLADVA